MTIIDGKRATNVAIAIARIKYEYEEIRRRLEGMDETVRHAPTHPPTHPPTYPVCLV